MADANREMLAIALAMGMTKNEFFALLKKNQNKIKKACACNTEIVIAIQDFLEFYNKRFIEGSVSDIFNLILNFKKGDLKGLPKSASAFSRSINANAALLHSVGIHFTTRKSKNCTLINLSYKH